MNLPFSKWRTHLDFDIHSTSIVRLWTWSFFLEAPVYWRTGFGSMVVVLLGYSTLRPHTLGQQRCLRWLISIGGYNFEVSKLIMKQVHFWGSWKMHGHCHCGSPHPLYKLITVAKKHTMIYSSKRKVPFFTHERSMVNIFVSPVSLHSMGWTLQCLETKT